MRLVKKTKGYKVIARGKPLRISASMQARYVNAIRKLVDKMTDEVEAELTALFKKDFAEAHFAHDSVGMDAKSVSSQTRILINAFKKRYDQLFQDASKSLSTSMADDVNQNSHNDTKASTVNLTDEAKKWTLSLKSLDNATKNILANVVNTSAHFITTIPERYLNSVADAVYASIATGNGLEDLMPFLEKQDVQITNWAHNTAMDQTRKAYNGLNAGRLKKIGIKQGEWLHSGGSQHPRELHEAFDGQIFDLDKGAPVGDDDGNDVMPGEEPNCRCSFGPVIALEDNENADETEE